jgi:hypothetical protein
MKILDKLLACTTEREVNAYFQSNYFKLAEHQRHHFQILCNKRIKTINHDVNNS